MRVCVLPWQIECKGQSTRDSWADSYGSRDHALCMRLLKLKIENYTDIGRWIIKFTIVLDAILE